MANRRDYFFKQKVTEDELDAGFSELEQADWNLAADLGVYGIISGAVATQHSPVANLTIDLTGPAKSYDKFGRRIYVGTNQNVDVSIDENGVATSVPTAGQERWLAVFIQFDRNLDDERIDGNGESVFFVRDEAFAIVVRQGAAAAAGTAVRVALDDQLLLVCDIKRSQGVNTILNAVIDVTRRQNFLLTDADHIELAEHVWTLLSAGSVQDALEFLDSFLGEDLADDADDALGASLVGFAAEGGTNPISAGTAREAIIKVRDALNTHVADVTSAHMAGSIGGLDITTGSVEITGASLSLYLTSLQNWVYSNVARRIGAASVTLNAAASGNVLSNLTVAPTSLRVRVAEPGWAANDGLFVGDEPSGGGWKYEDVAVEVIESGGTWDVLVKNNAFLQLRIYVEAYRVA